MKKFKNTTNEWEPSQGDYQIDYESTNTYQKKKRRKKILFISIIILLVAAALIGGYFAAEEFLFSTGRV